MWLQPEGYFTGRPPPPPPTPRQRSRSPCWQPRLPPLPSDQWCWGEWHVYPRREKKKRGFIRLCCSERRLRVVGKAWGWWWCRLFSSQRMRRHLCALHRKHHYIVWWKSERAIWDSTGSGWWLCMSVCVCVFGCVELKHGIVSETPSCTEPPLLHHMNNWCSMCSRYCSEMKCGIVHPGMEVCYWSRWPAAYDADAPVLPLQSDALSGALHPAPAQHGSEVLGPRTQDCPRNPIKAGSRMSDPPSLLIFQKSSGGPVCVFLSGFEVTCRRTENYSVCSVFSGESVYILHGLSQMVCHWYGNTLLLRCL